MQRTLIVIGLLVLVTGLLWPWLSQLPFGRLPGDIVVDRPGFRFYFPITTMILARISHRFVGISGSHLFAQGVFRLSGIPECISE